MTAETKTIEVKKNDGLAKEGNAALEQVENKHETERIRERRVFLPRTDIYETKDSLELVMDVPGVDEKSVEITLEKSILTINAYPSFARPEDHVLAYAEYGEGDYQRSFALSDEIDRTKIEAKVKNGVLYLHLAKAGAAKPHKISVKAG
jgi:HSP20 family molecular chaperone IbpA